MLKAGEAVLAKRVGSVPPRTLLIEVIRHMERALQERDRESLAKRTEWANTAAYPDIIITHDSFWSWLRAWIAKKDGNWHDYGEGKRRWNGFAWECRPLTWEEFEDDMHNGM